MEFGLTEEQEMLKTMARDFLTKECPKIHVRQMMEDPVGCSRDLWKKMADLGWLGLMLPEEHGGTGMSFRDLALVCEEMGRAVMPEPFMSTVILGAMPILNAGTKGQKKEFLPKIAKGEAIFTMAVTEEDGDFWAGGVKTKAIPDGSDYIISGTKVFVPDAKAADYMLVAARTRHSADPEDGITLFLVPAREWGVYITPLKTVDETRKLYDVTFTNVAVPARNIIGEVHQGWPIVKRAALYATAALCAEMVGGIEMALDMTVNYSKERMQFGVPIGSFQAIKHKCADMAVLSEYSRSLMESAVLSLNEDAPDAALAISMAKSYCGDSYKKVTNEGVQLHGGIGFTWDHDMHLYFKRARSSDIAFGDSSYHRELVAQSFG